MCIRSIFFSIALTIFLSTLYAESPSTHQKTLSIIKPDGVANHHIGEIITMFEKEGLSVVGLKMLVLTKKQAEDFYAVHRERPFYQGLVSYVCQGPVVVMVLQGEDAVKKNRMIMGATDPLEARAGTIRSRFAQSKQVNTVHGSDSPENAEKEIAFFFRAEEILQ